MSVDKFETASQKLIRQITDMERNHNNRLGRVSNLQTMIEGSSRLSALSSINDGISIVLHDSQRPEMSAVMNAATGALDKRMLEALGLSNNSAVMRAARGDGIERLSREMSSKVLTTNKLTTTSSKQLTHKLSFDTIRSASDLGPLIRRARKKMRMTQKDFAIHAGVGPRFLSELEGGKPSLEFDKVMACALAAGVEIFSRPRGGE